MAGDLEAVADALRYQHLGAGYEDGGDDGTSGGAVGAQVDVGAERFPRHDGDQLHHVFRVQAAQPAKVRLGGIDLEEGSEGRQPRIHERVQAYPEALFSADASVRYDPPVYDQSFNPAVSHAGDAAWEVIENQQGRVVVQTPGNDWQTILTDSVAYLLWDPLETRTLLIATRAGALYAAAAPDFAPVLRGNLRGVVDQAIWLP